MGKKKKNKAALYINNSAPRTDKGNALPAIQKKKKKLDIAGILCSQNRLGEYFTLFSEHRGEYFSLFQEQIR